MEVEGLWRREEEKGSGCLDPDASSTALTAPLQCLTLSSAFSCSTLRRPLSLSQPPSSIGGDKTLTDRGSLVAEGPMLMHLCLKTVSHRGRLRRRSDAGLPQMNAAADSALARRGIPRMGIGRGLRLLYAPCAARPS